MPASPATCVRRACRDVQVNDVIGMGFRGDHHRPGLRSRRRQWRIRPVWPAGECVAACPTGALMPKSDRRCGYADRLAGGGKGSRFRLPLLRRGLVRFSYKTPRRGDRLCRGARRAGQREPALRQGPLRLRLHQQSPAPDEAADPPREMPPRGSISTRPTR